MPFKVSAATAADIPAITSIFAHDEPSPFMKLCLGPVNILALNIKQADRVAQGLQTSEERWFVARDEEHHRTAGFAQWRLPNDDDDDEAEVEEELADDREAHEDSLTPGMNADLVIKFREQVAKLRKNVLGGQRHYLLMNLGTNTVWRRKGAAMALVNEMAAAADQKDLPIYLDTTSEGAGRQLFEKLGFHQVGRFDIELSSHGGRDEGTHTHLAMIRWPKSHTQCGS